MTENKPKIWLIPLKTSDFATDGITNKIQRILEDEGIVLTNLGQLMETKPTNTIIKILYYICKFSTQSSKYLDISLDDFEVDLLENNFIKYTELVSKIITYCLGANQEVLESDNNSVKKK